MAGRPPEETLVERARAGDDDAFAALVREHEEVAFRVAYLITGSASEAEEAAQEGFLKAHRSLRRFRRGSPFRPWALQIVANEARNRRRSAGRRAGLVLRAAAAESSGGAAPSPEADLLAAERRGQLLAAVGELPEAEQLVVACRFFVGLSELETAEALGIPAGTAKSRLSRALDRLRERIGEEE